MSDEPETSTSESGPEPERTPRREQEIFATTVFVDDVPPSSNTNTGVGGRGHPKAIARTKRVWQEVFGGLLMAAGVPRGLEFMQVRPRLEFRTRSRRDGDNFYFAISKPLGDILTKGGWIPDDTPDHYYFERVSIAVGVEMPQHLRGRLTLDLTWWLRRLEQEQQDQQ